MKASGWQEEVARGALEDVLRQRLAERPAGAVVPAVEPAAIPMPDPDLRGSPPTVWAHDREVRVVMSMHAPRVVVFADLLTATNATR